MTEQRTYPQGVPCWIDTEQPDLDAARDFYGRLFGWEFEDVMPAEAPGNYLIARLDGQDVAAISPAATGELVAWATYIAVGDADAMVEVVQANGGAVIQGPADAGEGGRMAECVDPHRANVRLWQPRRRLGAQLVNVPGTWNFSELHSADPGSAKEFYAAVFGWEFDDSPYGTLIRQPGYGDHLESTVDPDIRTRQASAPPGFADAIGWLVQAPEDQVDTWRVTFTVADRDDSAALVETLHGTVCETDDTEWTKTAVIRDPHGAKFTISQFTPPDSWD